MRRLLLSFLLCLPAAAFAAQVVRAPVAPRFGSTPQVQFAQEVRLQVAALSAAKLTPTTLKAALAPAAALAPLAPVAPTAAQALARQSVVAALAQPAAVGAIAARVDPETAAKLAELSEKVQDKGGKKGDKLRGTVEDLRKELEVGSTKSLAKKLDKLFDGSQEKGALDLDAVDSGSRAGFPKHSKKESLKLLADEQAKLRALQEKLYAGKRKGVLIVLQAMDTAGKDGVIKHVLTGINPAGVQVAAFKKPTAEEAAHDFLWRIKPHVPKKGMIGVFNRSHYEDILVPSVYKTLPGEKVEARYARIRAFEEDLAKQGITVVKLYLHISKDEQKERLQARLDEPAKNWKFDPNDLEARKKWSKFMGTYEKVLARTSTPAAPWYVIPADKKWYRNYVVARILRETLESMDLRYPDPAPGLDKVEVE